jgi:DNA-binding response OmpR family regulator
MMTDIMQEEPLKIYIVEDEILIAMDMEATLESAGYSVLGIADSLEAVKKSSVVFDADVVLLDYNLSTDFTGMDVCKYLRGQKSDQVIIFVSANSRLITLTDVDGDGVVDKPVSNRILMQILRYVEEGIKRPPPVSIAPAAIQFAEKFKHRILVN